VALHAPPSRLELSPKNALARLGEASAFSFFMVVGIPKDAF
jgi:hypothetical protein